MQHVLGRGGFSAGAMVQLPGGGWATRKSCTDTPDNQRRMNFGLQLLEGALKDHVANVLGPSSQIDNQPAFISFDMEPADGMTLGEYVQNNRLNYISPEWVQWVGLHVVRGLGCLHSKRILNGEMKTSNLFLFTGAQKPVIKIGDLGSSLRLDAFGVDSNGYIQRCITSYNYAAPEMLLAGIRNLPHLYRGQTSTPSGWSSSTCVVRSTPCTLSRLVGCRSCTMPAPVR